MKASLQLKLGQQLTMTPQLQQAIRLLQLSSLELQQEIQQALDSNPLLELEDEQFDAPTERNQNLSDTDFSESSPLPPEQDSSTVDTAESLTKESMPDELPMDTTWDEVFTASPNSGSGGSREDDMPFQGKPARACMNI